MRYFIRLLWVGFGLLASPVWGQSYSVETVPDPKPSGYVADPAGILQNPGVVNDRLAQLERETRIQMAVVVLPSIGEEVPRDFANRLFERWGVGQKGVDNGLLLLIVMDQRRSELEVGYGLEAILTDLRSTQLLEQELVPRFREADYDGGVLGSLAAIDRIVRNPSDPMVQDYLTQLDRASESGWVTALRWYAYATATVTVLFLLVWFSITVVRRGAYRQSLALRPLAWWVWAIPFPVPLLLLRWAVERYVRYLRNQSRTSATSGARLVKQDEQADDAYLSAGQRTEERLGSVDYDVWVNPDAPADKEVLAYRDTFSSYSKCPKCDYRTLKTTTRTISEPTYSSSGTGEKIEDCEHCSYRNRSTYTIPKLERSESSSSGGGGGGGGSSWGGGSSGGGGGGASW